MTLIMAISVSGVSDCSALVESGAFSEDSWATATKESAPASRPVIVVSFERFDFISRILRDRTSAGCLADRQGWRRQHVVPTTGKPMHERSAFRGLRITNNLERDF